MMFILLFRTALIYALIILAMRLMGKKQLGELQPSELVSTILISNLASISIESPELPLTGSIVPVFLIVVMEILVSALCVKSPRAATLIAGTPRVIIRNGVIDQETLYELRFTINDLLEALRGKDVFYLEEVALAIVETNGTVSVRKTADAQQPKAGEALAPFPLIVDGRTDRAAMRAAGFTEKALDEACRKHGIPRCNALLVTCTASGELRVVERRMPGGGTGKGGKA